MLEKILHSLISSFVGKLFIKDINGLESLPKNGSYIISANHSSYLDHYIIMSILKTHRNEPIYAMTKKESFNSLFWKKFHHAVGGIPVDRGEADTGTIKTIIKILKRDGIVCIHPEGTRTPTGKMYAGKQGAVRIANMAQVPIVPIGIIGSFDVLPKKIHRPRFKKVSINIGEPIKWEKLNDKDGINHIHTKLMNQLSTLSGNKNKNLIPLPTQKDEYIEEMVKTAHEYNERGIRQFPNDAMKPNQFHKRVLYISDQVLKEKPNNTRALFEKARAVARIGINTDRSLGKIRALYKARALLFKSIKLDSTFAPNYYALGYLYLVLPTFFGGNVQKSIDNFQKANELETEVYIKIGFAKSLMKVNKLEQAKKVLLESLDIPTKSDVDSRRKLESLAMIMRMDPKFHLEDGIVKKCLQRPERSFT